MPQNEVWRRVKRLHTADMYYRLPKTTVGGPPLHLLGQPKRQKPQVLLTACLEPSWLPNLSVAVRLHVPAPSIGSGWRSLCPRALSDCSAPRSTGTVVPRPP